MAPDDSSKKADTGKRSLGNEDATDGALKGGRRPNGDADAMDVDDHPRPDMGEFEDEFEDEFESEDEVIEAGVDGRPDAEREAEEKAGECATMIRFPRHMSCRVSYPASTAS